MIDTTLKTMFKDGDTIMVAILHQNGTSEWMGHEFYTTVEKAAAAANRYDQAADVAGIYITAQKLKPTAASNTIGDMAAYTHFVIDVDRKNKKVPVLDAAGQPVVNNKGKQRMRSTNATEAERAELMSVVQELVPWVSGILGAKPMICDSGNGYHLVWFLAQPCKVDPAGETQRTIQECILAIKQRFEKGNSDIDTSVGDPGQLIRLWGTMNRKAPQEPDRPWRRSKLLTKTSGVVLPSALDVLACQCAGTVESTPTSGKKHPVSIADPDWLEDYGIEDWCEWAGDYASRIGESYERGGNTHYKLGNCVFDTADGLGSHKEGSNQRHTELILYPDGGVKLSCLGSEDWFTEHREEFSFTDSKGNEQVPERPNFRMLVRRVNELKGEKYPERIFPEHTASSVLDEWADIDFDTDIAPEVREVQPGETPRLDNTGHVYVETPTGREAVRSPEPQPETDPEPVPSTKEFEIGAGNHGEGTPKHSLIGIRACDVQSQPMVWVWLDKIPGSAITWLSGKPDCGKSIVSLDIIMRVTTGTDWPDGAKNTMGAREVLLAASEDDPGKTLKPRLMASGADLSKVIIVQRTMIEGRGIKKRTKRQLQLKADIKLLKVTLRQNPQVAMVVFDPITAYWGDCDVNKDREIRPVLEGIADACSATSASFVAVVHHNKRSDVDAVGKILGASSVSAASRAAWGFSRDPKAKGEYFMCLIKGNLAKRRDGLKYSIVDTLVTLDNGEAVTMPRIEWLGEHEMNADDLIALQKKEAKDGDGGDLSPIDPAPGEAAKKFLLDELGKGPQLSRDLHRKREALDISDMTFKRAYWNLKIRPKQEPGGGKWWMALDEADLWWNQPEADPKLGDPEVM